ncbi:TetR family transcriptional regulator [Nocardia otitidiscaviarum]|uniref:TetR/AcrR family transcriptional regulator n=1 Tax=Nocardia otitidiscaviarum TaxID=1823 RepID=UPI0004A6C125|nr:TetR/AcrR family transcriptional regulator [Nocardia otitidiscaviarum]MBF6133339.1 TetR family transcriptional regulator [Nocardia otitidiscaviarum]MBF6486735.1 TetR family transcriptional regulator [Nocardia otitidiscaviarum]
MVSSLPPNKHQEKSLRTRALLLDAAIDSLAEVGYGSASIADITARAGVTRGAQLHHFHTRQELFAQAIGHLTQRQREAMRRRLRSLSATGAGAVLVELVTATFAGKLGRAAVELYVGIANDRELRREMLRAQHELTTELLDACAARIDSGITTDRLESAFWLTINLVRGTTLDEMVGRDRARRKQVLADWTELADTVLRR